jgi:cytochrome P450
MHQIWEIPKNQNLIQLFLIFNLSLITIVFKNSGKLTMKEIQNYNEIINILKSPNFWIIGQTDHNFDPNVHASLRQVFVKVLQENQALIRDKIEQICNKNLERLANNNKTFDLQRDFSFEFCNELAFALLDVQVWEFQSMLQEAAWDIFYMNDAEEKYKRGEEASMRIAAYFMEALRTHKSEHKTGLLAAFAANTDGGAASIGHIVQLFAGTITSLSLLLGNAISALLQYPEQLTIYLKNPEAALNELLRIAGPSQIIYRKVSDENSAFEKDTILALNLHKANRDPQVFENPKPLDFGCPHAGQLSLGKGAHSCLGAPLIRMVLAVVPKLFFEKLPNLEANLSSIEISGCKDIKGVYRLEIKC